MLRIINHFFVEKGAKRNVKIWTTNFYMTFLKIFCCSVSEGRQKIGQYIRMLWTRWFILNGIVRHSLGKKSIHPLLSYSNIPLFFSLRRKWLTILKCLLLLVEAFPFFIELHWTSNPIESLAKCAAIQSCSTVEAQVLLSKMEPNIDRLSQIALKFI